MGHLDDYITQEQGELPKDDYIRADPLLKRSRRTSTHRSAFALLEDFKVKTVTTPLRSLAKIVAVAGLIVMSIAGTAAAQPYPSTAGATTSGSLVPGGTVTINGTGDPGDSVVVTVYSDPVIVASGAVGADGTFSLTATIPSDLAPGSHELVVEVGGVVVSSTTFIVAGEVAAGSLPVTGGNSLPLLSLSLGLIAVGALVLVARRKITTA